MLYPKEEAHKYQNYEESEVKERKLYDIAERVIWVLPCVFLKCYKACKRGNESTRAADVYTEQELFIIIRKLREQYCRGDVADKLAGEGGEYERILLKKVGKEASNRLNSRHISRENKEENEGQKKAVVNRA